MAAKKLSATKIEKHRFVGTDDTLFDGNGLYLRFRRGRTGAVSRTWIYAYKDGARSAYMTLGDYDASLPDSHIRLYKLTGDTRLTLECARRIATELTDWRGRGTDPKTFTASEVRRYEEEARQAIIEAENMRKQQHVDQLSLRDLFDAWLLDGVQRKDGNAELRRSFSANILPLIGNVQVKALTEHHLRSVLRAMAARGVNRATVIARNNLTQMFAWAEKRQPWRKLLAEGNPMALVDIEKIVSRGYDFHNLRSRILSSAEIRELHARLAQMRTDYSNAPNKRIVRQPLEHTTELAIWIMLSTMCRVGEMVMARWEHVDVKAGRWFIPKENVKDNVADLTVYLSDFARSAFEQLYTQTYHSRWCFPARFKDSHNDPKTIGKQIGDRQAMFKHGYDGAQRAALAKRRCDNSLVLAGGKNGAWTPHDLRRTGATIMQSLGVPLETIDRCQNHVLAGSRVRRHYLLHDYADEKRDAWGRLGTHLESILDGSAVDDAPF